MTTTRTRRTLLAALLTITLGAGITTAVAGHADAAYSIGVSMSLPQHGDYSAGGPGVPCVAGGTGTAGGPGRMGISAYFQNCSPWAQHFTCTRLKRGSAFIAQVCTPAQYWLTAYTPLTYFGCVGGAVYSIEVVFFHGADVYQRNSTASLQCRSYA